MQPTSFQKMIASNLQVNVMRFLNLHSGLNWV